MDYHGKKVAIVGYGVEGESSYRYWQAKGADLTICDANPQLVAPPGAQTQLGEGYLENLDSFDLIVHSPGVLPHMIKTTKPVTTNMNEFLATCQGLVIGITGTKGKGTTAVLIYHILTTAIKNGTLQGKTAFLGGNIGKPPLDFVAQTTPGSISVLEMSNLQLWDIKKSPQIAVVLMLAPDHLDWHKDLAEYLATKANITAFQGPQDMLVYDASNSYASAIAKHSKARLRPYGKKTGVHIEGDQVKFENTLICNTSDIPLLGKHNWGNVAAAIGATWDIVKSVSSIKEAVRSTKPLPHRLEFVAEKAGVKYYDDSIGTINDAVLAAVNAFTEPKVLILGGADKGVGFEPLARGLKGSSLRAVLLIGQSSPKLRAELEAAGVDKALLTDVKGGMPQIVQAAATTAQPGDVVLLSPGCASFDMFANYSDRGRQFQAAVNALTD